MKRKLFALLFIVLVGVGFYFLRAHYPSSVAKYKTEAEKNLYVRFDMEAYDLISENYWKLATSSDYAQLFQLSLQKAENLPTLPAIKSQDRAGVADMLLSAFNTSTSTDLKKQLAINILNVALYNLVPQGRDRLLSTVEQKQVSQDVVNINPSNDLYQNLDLQKGASQEAIDQAYKKKESELAKATTTKAKSEFAKATYAHEVLTDSNKKQIYDQTQVEPTVFNHIIGDTLYIYISKISPNTITEFAKAVDSASTTERLSSMIIDLRGNVGGDLSFPQYFLGLFLGQNQYAFDLYHRGDYQVERTVTAKFPELSHYREYAVVVDSMTQSTAELLAASLKKFRIAGVIGGKTRGWGSVENIYPMTTAIDPNTSYSLLLVNSLTLRDDNQPIEINGVLPDVDTGSPDWKKQLPNYFNSPDLIKVLERVASNPPQN